MSRALLVRHGQTEWNQRRRIQGWAPTTLTEVGREEARVVGEWIATNARPERIIASDLRRTRETVREITRSITNVTIQYDNRWRERNFGVLQGLSYSALFGEYPEYSLRETGLEAVTAIPDRGESLLDMHQRVISAWDEVVGEIEPNEIVLIVSHGGPIRSVLGHVQGIDLIRTMLEIEQENCAVNEILLRDGAGQIIRENENITT